MSSELPLTIDEIRSIVNNRRGNRPISPKNVFSKVNFQKIVTKLGGQNNTTSRIRLNGGVSFRAYRDELNMQYENLSPTEKQKYETVSSETGYVRRTRKLPERSSNRQLFRRP